MSLVITFVTLLFYALYLAIFVRVLLSWINIRPDHPIAHFVYDITEPILAPLRNHLPTVGPLDISPFVAMILLDVIRRVVIYLLSRLHF